VPSEQEYAVDRKCRRMSYWQNKLLVELGGWRCRNKSGGWQEETKTRGARDALYQDPIKPIETDIGRQSIALAKDMKSSLYPYTHQFSSTVVHFRYSRQQNLCFYFLSPQIHLPTYSSSYSTKSSSQLAHQTVFLSI
jgi:hypothetical protein